MHLLHKAALIAGLMLSVSAQATEVAGVKFDDSTKAGETELVLNGAGLRKKLVFKVYAMGLYLGAHATTPAEVYAAKGFKRVQIVTLRELTAEQLSEALEKGIESNTAEAELTKLRARVDEFRSNLLALEKIPEGTTIRIDWTGSNTRVSIGGTQKGKDIAGEDFYNALLRIWLGDTPAQDDLKAALLGKK